MASKNRVCDSFVLACGRRQNAQHRSCDGLHLFNERGVAVLLELRLDGTNALCTTRADRPMSETWAACGRVGAIA